MHTSADGVEAKCISCSSVGVARELDDRSWDGRVLPSGLPVSIQQILCETIDVCSPMGDESQTGCDDNEESLYADEPFVMAAPPELQARLLEIQNCTYVRLNPRGPLPSLPFFVSFGDLSTPARKTVVMRLMVDDISQVPDVAAYISEGESVLSDFFGPLAQPKNRLAVPVGCYLPMVVADQYGETPGVYRIEQYVEDAVVIAELCMVTDRSLGLDAAVARRRINRVGRVFDQVIGVIEEIKLV